MCTMMSVSVADTLEQGAGYGKTTRAAVTALCLVDRFKKVYASGPTHIAVNNFAERTDRVDAQAVDHCRRHGEGTDPPRVRRLIIRARQLNDNVRAVRMLLEKPALTEAEMFPWQAGRNDRWQLQNSLAYWILKAVGSPAVAELDDCDPEAVRAMRDGIVSVHGGQRLLDAIKAGDWDIIAVDKAVDPPALRGLMNDLQHAADMIFGTPAMATKDFYSNWINLCVGAFAVDEAANMRRADMIRVWGNSLLPMAMAGDGTFDPQITLLCPFDG
jgi:hypothetical protein